MKKQLLSIFAAATVLTGMAQTPSPSWTINQSGNYTPSVVATTMLYAVDANTVWGKGENAIDGGNNELFTKTTNGGTSWTSGNLPDTNIYINANIEGIDGNTAWVSSFLKASQSQGAIHRTTNGGATWVNMTTTNMYTNTAAFTNIVSFFTPSVGITMGDPVNNAYEIWRTTDGGTTWSQIPSSSIPPPTPGEFGIVDLYCKFGTTHLWYGTQRGRVYRTTDAGLTWAVSNVAANTFTVTDLSFSSPMKGIVIGVNTGNTWEAYNTTNGGVTWNQIAFDPNLGRNDICNIPGTEWFASVENQGNAGGRISYSKDNGVTWTDWMSTGIQYFSVAFANTTTGWVGTYKNFPFQGNLGIYKYNGNTFNSNFTLPNFVCKPIGNATTTPVNNSAAASGVLTYSWSSNSGAVSFSSPTATVPVITFTATGTYTIVLAAANATNSINTSSQVVTVLTCSTPVAGFNIPSSSCNNIALTLTNTSVGAPSPSITITTNPASNVTITPGSGSLTTLRFGTPGIYTVSLNASSAAGSDVSTQTVTINNCNPVVSFTGTNLYSNTFYRCIRTDSIRTVNTTSALTTGLITYTWSASPSSGVTYSPSATASAPLIRFASSVTPVYTITLRATNSSGTASAVQVLNMDYLCVGLNENNKLQNILEVYPNPAKDILHVSLPPSTEAYEVKMTNILGSIIYDEKAINNKEGLTISLTNKPKGVYFLTVTVNNEKVTKKIIIE